MVDRPSAGKPIVDPAACRLTAATDLPGVTQLALRAPRPLPDYRAAMTLAKRAAEAQRGDVMLLSWYDRDRDFEAPQHVSECHQDSAVPGYVDYAVSRGATLRVDVEEGRFVFFFLPVGPA
jgi:hypothetical protein